MNIRPLLSCFFVCGVLAALMTPSFGQTVRQILKYKPVQTQVSDLKIGDVGPIKAFLKSNQIQLENGNVFTLDNVRTPIYYEERAKDFMEKQFKGKTVGVYSNATLIDEGRLDPHGNEFVHAITSDGVWLEKELVSHGFAMVTSTEVNRDLVDPLDKAEIRARASHQGFWASAEFAVRSAETIKGVSSSFIIFEDVVNNVTTNGEFDYVNFVDHANKRSFTLTIKKENFLLFYGPGMDNSAHVFSPYKWKKIRMRVRGWVDIQDGIPTMAVTNPQQIEYPEGPPVW